MNPVTQAALFDDLMIMSFTLAIFFGLAEFCLHANKRNKENAK